MSSTAAAASSSSSTAASESAAPTGALTNILLRSQSSDPTERKLAETQLLAAEESNFSEYLAALSQELANESSPDAARHLAGLILKNAISGSDQLIDKTKREKWLRVSDDVANPIKELALTTLRSPVEAARSAACQVISKIGRLELTMNKWSLLLPTMMQFVTSVDAAVVHQKAAVTAVGYLCEDIGQLCLEMNVDLLQPEQRNMIITIVTHGIRSSNSDVVLASCKAFYHALLFAKENMGIESECEFIFQMIGQCLSHADLRVQHAAWECVLQITSEYYEQLEKYAGVLGDHSIRTISAAIAMADAPNADPELKLQGEAVALAALEFWNNLCDIEIELKQDEQAATESRNFIRRAKGVLLPVLFEAMTKQDSPNSDMGEWTLAMAAGACVGLCAQVISDEILEPALEFVNSNFGNPDWKRREAAVLAYGSIMEGPTSERLEPLVQQSFEHLCRALADESVAVRDTTAWTVGRIASFHVECVVPLLGNVTEPGLMNLLLEKLNDEPRVAAYVCYAIHEIAKNINSERASADAPTIIDTFFRQLAPALLQAAQRGDAAENNLRASAFEALAEVIEVVCSPESLEIMEHVQQQLLLLLDRALSLPPTEELYQLQGLVSGCLNTTIDRMIWKPSHSAKADTIFRFLVRVIEAAVSGSSPRGDTVAFGGGSVEGLRSSEERASVGSEEDALLALGSLLRVMPDSIERHMTILIQILVQGLKNPNDVRFCRACIGVVCEISVGVDLRTETTETFVATIVPLLLEILSNSTAPMSLKPPLISCVGDIAVGMETKFEPFLPPVLELLDRAASIKYSEGPANEEWLDYFQELRDSVLDAYSALLHGFRAGDQLAKIELAVNRWLVLVASIVEDKQCSASNFTKSVEVVSDLVACFRGKIVPSLVELPFYKQMIQRGLNSDDDDIKKRTDFLRSTVDRCGNKTP